MNCSRYEAPRFVMHYIVVHDMVDKLIAIATKYKAHSHVSQANDGVRWIVQLSFPGGPFDAAWQFNEEVDRTLSRNLNGMLML